MLVAEAKNQFKHDVHPQFQALKLMNGCTNIPEDHVGTLTYSLDIKAQDFPEKVEQIIRSFVANKKAMLWVIKRRRILQTCVRKD